MVKIRSVRFRLLRAVDHDARHLPSFRFVNVTSGIKVPVGPSETRGCGPSTAQIKITARPPDPNRKMSGEVHIASALGPIRRTTFERPRRPDHGTWNAILMALWTLRSG